MPKTLGATVVPLVNVGPYRDQPSGFHGMITAPDLQDFWVDVDLMDGRIYSMKGPGGMESLGGCSRMGLVDVEVCLVFFHLQKIQVYVFLATKRTQPSDCIS